MSFCSKLKNSRAKSEKSSHQTDRKINQKANHKLNSKLNRKTFFKRKYNKHSPQPKRIPTQAELEELEQLDWASKFFLKISGAALAVIIFGLVLAVTSGSKASDSSTPVSVRVLQACALSSTTLTAHSISMSPSTVSTDIAQTKISALCNDSGGYEIYAIGQSDGEDGNTDMISALGSAYNIKTGTATSGSVSAWGMKLVAGTGTGSTTTPPTISSDYTSYHAVPSTQTLVASRNSATSMSTDTASTGSYLTAMYQVYASGSQAAGTYSGQVRYTMFHPNDGTGLTTLEDALEAAKAETATKDGKTYYTMQGLTSSICSAAKIHGEASQIQLLDKRDNKLYWVTKTDDERCWMTQNLDLDLSTSTALTSENTDLNVTDSGAYGNGYSIDSTTGIISWTPLRNTIDASSNMTTTGTAGSISGWSNDYNTPYSVNVGNVYQTSTAPTSCNYLTTDCDSYSNTASDTNGEHGHVGNYYNWSAAIASNASNSLTTNNYNGNSQDNPKNSICPKNWELPTIDTYSSSKVGLNDFANLNYYYNASRTNTDAGLIAAPLYFARSGRVNGGSLVNSGSYGYYWSSTVNSSSRACGLYFSSGRVYPADYILRDYGFSVRCVVTN